MRQLTVRCLIEICSKDGDTFIWCNNTETTFGTFWMTFRVAQILFECEYCYPALCWQWNLATVHGEYYAIEHQSASSCSYRGQPMAFHLMNFEIHSNYFKFVAVQSECVLLACYSPAAPSPCLGSPSVWRYILEKNLFLQGGTKQKNLKNSSQQFIGNRLCPTFSQFLFEQLFLGGEGVFFHFTFHPH